MTKNIMISAVCMLALSVSGVSEADAFNRRHKVTPYGDFCNTVSHYGMHKSIIDMHHAKEALHHYFKVKGLDVEIISKQGRFLKAHIMDGKEIVDTIIFDRHSGRVRSIH